VLFFLHGCDINEPGFSRYYPYLPPEKLPYPMQDPAFSPKEYNKMLDEVFIVNNFGLYQLLYLHDGLDFVTPNGTRIFAVAPGYVRAIIDGGLHYKTLIIEDELNRGYAWGYTHVDSFAVKPGDFVEQGDFLAVVSFQGLEHIHLSRFKLNGNNWDSLNNLLAVQPDGYFYFRDTKPPIIKKPFYYFKNNSDTMFVNEGIIKVKGKVDIVAGMRETGEYARGLNNTFGDRLAVSKISYSIKTPEGHIYSYRSFDFSKIYISFNDAFGQSNYIFKNYILFEDERTSWSDTFSYYIISNYTFTDKISLLNPDDDSNAWDTNEKNADGTAKFPNGKYTITITAFDFAGHTATESEYVEVEN